MSLVMYDSITLEAFHGLTMDAAAGYVDGNWPTYSELPQHTPAGTIYLSITVFGNPAECVDQEPGNIEPAPAADWIAAQVRNGMWKPVLYTSASNVENMLNLCAQRGVGRGEIRVWAAHYTEIPHICSPAECGYPQADGTQWTSTAHGRNLDQSMLEDTFFKQTAKPPPTSTEDEEDMFYLSFKTNPDNTINDDTTLSLTNSQGDGNHRIRFACRETQTLRVDLCGAGPTWRGGISYANPNGFTIPRGCKNMVIHVDNPRDLAEPIAVAIGPQ